MSGLRWSVGLRLLGQLFAWAATILVIRLLSPGDYGLMSLAGTFIALLSMINEMGLGTAIVQRKDLDQNDLQTVFGYVLVVSLLICSLLLVLAPFIAGFYGEPDLISILWALSLVFIFSALAVVPRSLVLRDLQYRKVATVDFAANLAGSISTLTMALAGMGVWSLVGGFLTIRIVSMVGFHVAHPFLYSPRIRLRGMGSIVVFSGQITASRILWYLYASAAASLIIGKVLGSEALGFFAVGLHLACLPMEKVGGIINQVALPAFSSIQSDRSLAGAHFLKAVRVMFFVTVPIFFGMSSIAPEIVGVFLGDRWLEAIIPFQIIAFVVPLRMVRSLMAPAVNGLGRADISLFNDVVAFVLLPTGFLIATLWGLIGVSLVWVLVFPAVFVMNLAKASTVLNLSPGDVYREMSKPVLSGSVMYACIIVVREFSTIDWSMIVNMLVYVSVGAVVYSTMTLLIDRRVLNETIGLVKS
jgi:O-antigen/teichoic acid export membrane protein